MLRTLSLTALIAVLAVNIGCKGTSTPIPHPAAVVHLYVADASANGVVRAFTLPLTSTATAVLSPTLVHGGISPAANPAGTMLAVSDNTGHISILSLPLGPSSTLIGTFVNGPSINSAQLVWSSTGTLYTSTQTALVELYTAPFSNSSVPSGNVATTLNTTVGVAFDVSGTLYITDGTNNTIAVWNGSTISTVTAPAGSFLRGAIASSTQLFVANVAGAGKGIFVFNLPLVAGPPAFTITTGLSAPEGVALDAQGNLYVSDITAATISVYVPPFSSTSTPTVVLPVPSTSIFDISIGP